MSLSTHVLDTAAGTPAVGLALTLERHDGERWAPLTSAVTDDDGRVGDLAESLAVGVFRITFDTGRWWTGHGTTGFFPSVTVTFEVTEPDSHHHVPLLLSPYGFTTYRGS